MKIEYFILAADNHSDLTQAVQLHIADGWEPVGGIAVSSHTDRWENERKGGSESCTYETWAQAVIRRAPSITGDGA